MELTTVVIENTNGGGGEAEAPRRKRTMSPEGLEKIREAARRRHAREKTDGPIGELARLAAEIEELDRRRAEIAAEIGKLKPALEKVLRAAGIQIS